MRLQYEKYNNSENVIKIDLHNGYSIIAVSGFDYIDKIYTTSLFLKGDTLSDWKLIEEAECIKFHAKKDKINSAILKQVGTYLKEGFFQYYIERYEYEMKCFDKGNDLFEIERMNRNAS